METGKVLTKDQLEKLTEIIRQRFEDLYQRIGTNRQKLATTVLSVHQSINKELAKEKIDPVREKQILNKLREIEREANNQLPHVHKVSIPAPAVVKIPTPKTPVAKTLVTKAKTPAKTRAKKK